MYGTFGQMKCHRPVIRNCINNILHSCMNRCLRRPYMSADNRNILRDVAIYRSHEFSILLVYCIVRQSTEAFVVYRFPNQLIEDGVLRPTGAQRIKLILLSNYLGTGGLREAVKIQPVRRISQCLCCTCHGHGDSVVTESHTDITNDNALLCIEFKRRCTIFQTDIIYSKRIADDGILTNDDRVINTRVITEFLSEFLLRLYCFLVNLIRKHVSKDHL